MSDRLRLVVFDCDGTLVDSQYSIHESMRRAFERHGLIAPSRNDVRRIVGLSLTQAIAKLGTQGAQINDLVESYKQAFFELRQEPDHEEHLFPGTVEAIEALDAAGYLLGVATGKAMRGLKATLENHQLMDKFVTLQTADDNPSKPHPEMLYTAIDEAGVAAENTVLVGDTSYDIMMAASAGVASIGVSWGYHEAHELTRAGAATVIDHFDALAGATRELIG